MHVCVRVSMLKRQATRSMTSVFCFSSKQPLYLFLTPNDLCDDNGSCRSLSLLLAWQLKWTLLPKEYCGKSLSGCGSIDQPFDWDAGTVPLSYCRPRVFYFSIIIRTTLFQTGKTDVTDVLAAMGAFPAGFRPSTLHNLTKKGPQYSLRNAILPKLTESNLAFHDLFLDPVTTQVLVPLVCHCLLNQAV